MIPGLLTAFVQAQFSTVVRAALTTYISYWCLILVFTAAYRVSPFHPLARYPGPILAKVSKGWHVCQSLDGKQHVYLRRLHDTYGDIVRIGEVSSPDGPLERIYCDLPKPCRSKVEL